MTKSPRIGHYRPAASDRPWSPPPAIALDDGWQQGGLFSADTTERAAHAKPTDTDGDQTAKRQPREEAAQ